MREERRRQEEFRELQSDNLYASYDPDSGLSDLYDKVYDGYSEGSDQAPGPDTETADAGYDTGGQPADVQGDTSENPYFDGYGSPASVYSDIEYTASNIDFPESFSKNIFGENGNFDEKINNYPDTDTPISENASVSGDNWTTPNAPPADKPTSAAADADYEGERSYDAFENGQNSIDSILERMRKRMDGEQ